MTAEATPVLILRPSKGFFRLDLKALWEYRELLYFLVWRDIKVRYKQTALGAAWAILQPVMTMVVFSIFFGRLAKVPSDGVPYPDLRLRAPCCPGSSSPTHSPNRATAWSPAKT